MEKLQIEPCPKDYEINLADLRERAMRESLQAIGRYDKIRVRQRLLDSLDYKNAKIALINNDLVGFYVLLDKDDHFYLDHLYVDPKYQSKKIGAYMLKKVIEIAHLAAKPIKLGALKESRANNFYLSHGFIKTHEEDYDNYYELKI